MAIYKFIEGFEHYKISDEGDIQSCKRSGGWNSNWYSLKLRKNHKTGYIYAGLYYGKSSKERKYLRVHRLVWQTFVGCIPDTHVVDHIDGDKANNKLSNLQLLTWSENSLKYYKLKKTK